MNCKECGASLPDNTKFCTNCGKPADGVPQAQPTAPQARPAANPAPQAASDRSSRPISTLGYIGIFILFAIPVIGIITCIVWAFSSSVNANRRNLSRAVLFFTVLGIILAIVFTAFAATLTKQFSPYIEKYAPWIKTDRGEAAENESSDGIFGSFSDILNGLAGTAASENESSEDLLADENRSGQTATDAKTSEAEGLAWIDGNFKIEYETDAAGGVSAMMNSNSTDTRLNITLIKAGDVLLEDRKNSAGQALYLRRVEDGKVVSYIFNTEKKIAKRETTSHTTLAESAKAHLAGICKTVQKKNKFEKIGEEDVAGLRCNVLQYVQKAEDNEYAKLAKALGGDKGKELAKQLDNFSGTSTVYESQAYPGTILRSTVKIGSKPEVEVLKVSYFRPSASMSDIPYDIDMSHYKVQ
ncbi:MAG: zinc-ribbon domain-containing protein [Dysgonamonadaceae bacterium]|jgi:hypothetical protein|nr:zinc-ribbon domain-containing protein [Dysgonamonadaceae bacterium]